MEEKIFKYGSYSYTYYLIRQRRKTISLTVYPSLRIVLRCPDGCDNERIEKFLRRKWAWIEKQIAYFKKFAKKSRKKGYISGESFFYLGRQYKLLVKKGKEDGVKLSRGRLNLSTTGKTYAWYYNKYVLNKWYQERMKIIFKEELVKALEKFDLDFIPKILIRKMDKRWGSFLSNKKIVLNPKLIQAPRECIFYVIIHELCHIIHKDHDKKFYALLKSKIRNWEEIKEKLELRFL